MKQLLLIAGTAILLVAAPFVLWHLTDDPLERRGAPLLGEWRSTRDDAHLVIEPHGEGFRIALTRYDLRDGYRHRETHALRYKTCIYFTTYDGRHVDLFYTLSADALLLMPGGAFRRINPKTE